MFGVLRLVILSVALLFEQGVAWAEFKIAVIGKTKNDSFYEQAFQGCENFAEGHKDLSCIYDGPADFQDPRGQARVVADVIERGIDGLLISTTDSTFLVERVLRKALVLKIPVITIDSDLLEEHKEFRLAYVGTNNFDFGVALGNYAKKIKPEGETEICIQSGSDTTPNLNERIRGVRYALSGNYRNSKLNGENGWREHERCPFYTLGKREQALRQLTFLLKEPSPAVYLAVAGFAQFSPDYIKELTPYGDDIRSGRVKIISADAEQLQIEALRRHLSTVNIGQRPMEMGRVGAELLYQYLKTGKKPEKEINYLGFYYCINNFGVECVLGD